MYFTWRLYVMTPAGKKEHASGVIDNKDSVPSAKRETTKTAPISDALRKAGWIQSFRNCWVKVNGHEELVLRGWVSEAAANAPSIFATKSMGG